MSVTSTSSIIWFSIFLQEDPESESVQLSSSFAANTPRRNLNNDVSAIQKSMDNSLKNIISAFNDSNTRKLQARQQLEKAVHRRVNYNAPPAFTSI